MRRYPAPTSPRRHLTPGLALPLDHRHAEVEPVRLDYLGAEVLVIGGVG